MINILDVSNQLIVNEEESSNICDTGHVFPQKYVRRNHLHAIACMHSVT